MPQSVQMQVRGRNGRHSPPDMASPPGMDQVGSRSRVMNIDSASASHRAVSARLSLLHQSELHGGAVADHNQCRCRCVVATGLRSRSSQTLNQSKP